MKSLKSLCKKRKYNKFLGKLFIRYFISKLFFMEQISHLKIVLQNLIGRSKNDNGITHFLKKLFETVLKILDPLNPLQFFHGNKLSFLQI